MWLYQVSSISHQTQKPMNARAVWHPTFISPHLSSDWSWARSNYMNNRQRGINQRRHLKIMPRPENDQLLSDTSRVLAGMMQLYWRWRLWCEIFVVCHVRLSQTVSDCLFEWHQPGPTNGLADIPAGLRSSIIKRFKQISTQPGWETGQSVAQQTVKLIYEEIFIVRIRAKLRVAGQP